MTVYLVDANILIAAHNGYYSLTRVPEFWAWLLHHAEAGRIKMPAETMDEIKEGTGDAEKDELFAWLQGDGVKDALLLKEDVDMQLVQQVVTDGYAPDLNEVELVKIGRDPFLIAYGRADPADRCVVTNEKSSPAAQRSKRKVPDICGQFGVPCCDVFGLLSALKFSTNWKPAE
jgi:hypothetical protein